MKLITRIIATIKKLFLIDFDDYELETPKHK